MNWSGRHRRSAIGIDIGGRSIKCVQLRRAPASSSGWRLEAAVILPQPEINLPVLPQTAHYVREALDRHGFVGNRVVIGASVRQLAMDVLELPPRASGAPIEQIARLELSRNAKLDPQGFELAFWELPAASRASAATATMALGFRHDDAQGLLDPFEAQGFDVVAIDAPCCALARAARPLSSEENLTAILDIGYNSAVIDLLLDGVVIYQRVLTESGMGIIIRAIQDEFGLGDEEVDYVLSAVGVSGAVEDIAQSRRISQLVSRHVETMLDEVRVALNYAGHRYANTPLRTVLLAGGGAAIGGICGFIAARLEADAMIISPTSIVEVPAALTTRCTGGTLATALGLALRDSPAGHKRIDREPAAMAAAAAPVAEGQG